MLGFIVFAAIQSVVMVAFSLYVIRIHYAGHVLLVFFFTLLLTLGAVIWVSSSRPSHAPTASGHSSPS